MTALLITIVGIISAANVATITLVATLLSNRLGDVATRLGAVEHGLQEVRERLTTLEVKLLGER